MFFVFAPESNELLSKVTASFDALELSIIEAQLQTSNYGLHSIPLKPSCLSQNPENRLITCIFWNIHCAP